MTVNEAGNGDLDFPQTKMLNIDTYEEDSENESSKILGMFHYNHIFKAKENDTAKERKQIGEVDLTLQELV
ncbi:hypothetical protein Moror_10845 [Moniliophthora roreri MCA 2997]|uniref:Uncharacterized protein n=1 Tax=Moniliophthora roreri (strain MCA 2997) TaxID=1381753 RepID=V2X666_MONRO|nr:hypothetical protein Moror_10845 [Moniliophthora roreri MCA 2997]